MNTPSCDATIQDAISFAVTQFDHPASVLVGFSGGLDSVVLLDALHRLQTPHIVRIIAAHVHHGISPHADDWLSFCETFCAERDIPFLFRKIELRRIPQSSLEEEARNARRAALRSMAIEAQADTIALAHHQDDQVEALLLQLLRGAGPHGLAAMASWQPRYDANIALWRPFLILPRQKLAEYAAVRRLRWIEDESNGDIGFKRNYLRHRVFPVIAQAFPAYRKTLARAALLQADVASMIDQSLPASIIEFPSDFPISLDDFTRLPDDLARHTLRRAIRNAGLRAPNYRHLTEMTRQLKHARPDARVEITLERQRIGIHKKQIYLYTPIEPYRIDWHGENILTLPHGTLHFGSTQGTGIDATLLNNARKVWISGRQNNKEVLKCAHRPRRAIIDLLREANIPHWARDRWPRLYLDNELAAVPNIGINERFLAAPKANGFRCVFQETDNHHR